MEQKGVSYTNFSVIDARLKESFKKIRDEMDAHLETINDNSAEIQQSYDITERLEQRMDKLDEKINELSLMIKQIFANNTQEKTQYMLSKYEQKIFLALYTEEEAALSAVDISIRLNLSDLIVKAALSSLAKKGIPVLKAEVNGKTYFKLDRDFREMQAKDNILNIEAAKKEKASKLTAFMD